MEYAIQASGAICGWVFIECLVAGVLGKKCPLLFNIGCAFVGFVIATNVFLK